MTSKAVPERIRWAVRILDPAPGDHLLEIGCGPGVAVSLVCEALTGGQILAIDRSPTAIARATRRNAGCIAAGKAVLRAAALESLQAADLLEDRQGFDKVFAMNVNLFWTRSPARELDLIRTVLQPGGSLSLFYGYGTSSQGPRRVPRVLFDHLRDAGFTVERVAGPSVLGVVAAR
jgi:SAM-dependent methyltransferase